MSTITVEITAPSGFNDVIDIKVENHITCGSSSKDIAEGVRRAVATAEARAVAAVEA